MKFWQQVKCRNCALLIESCQCKPIPCPFCDAEFGFTQDWNIHLNKVHKIQQEGEICIDY